MLPFSRMLNYGNNLNNVILDGIYTQIGTNSIGTFDFGSVVYNNKIYVMGGVRTGAIATQTFFYFDIENPGVPVNRPNIPKFLFGFGCSLYDDKIYIYGGTTRSTSDGANSPNTSLHVYNITTNSWSTLTPSNPPGVGGYCKFVTVGDVLYLYGVGTGQNQLYKYDPILNSFTTLASSVTTGTPWGLCSDGTYLYISKVNTIERYNISTNTWSTLQSSTGINGNIMYLNGYVYIQDKNMFGRYNIDKNELSIVSTSVPYTRGALLTNNNKGYCIMGLESPVNTISNRFYEIR